VLWIAWELLGDSRAPLYARAAPQDIGAGSPRGTSLARFGAVGNGEHDDTAALRRALRSGRRVYSDPGKTYLVRGVLALSGRADFRRSTIVFVGGSAENYIGIRVIGRKARLSNVTIDGTGRVGSYVHGVHVGTGRELIARNVWTRDTRGGGGGYGFVVDGALMCSACDAQGADYGFFVRGGADPKTTISGTSSRNGIGLRIHGQGGGWVPTFVSRDDDRFGVLFDRGASHWKLGRIVTSDAGRTARRTTATGLEFWRDNAHNTIDSLVSNGNPGYALAFGYNATHNRVRVLSADGAGALDSDPGITLTGGASHNIIDRATVRNHSVGLRIGEDNTTLNIGNRFGSLFVENCAWSGIRIEYGTGNRIETATLVNNSTADSAYPGDVSFANAVRGNSIGRVVQFGSSARPIHGIYFGPGANRNRVEAGSVRSYSTSKVVDESGTNLAAVK
jgi:hypothetical protein